MNGLVSVGYSGIWVDTRLTALSAFSPPTTNNDPNLSGIDSFTTQALFG